MDCFDGKSALWWDCYLASGPAIKSTKGTQVAVASEIGFRLEHFKIVR
jgi:hypothetical protein